MIQHVALSGTHKNVSPTPIFVESNIDPWSNNNKISKWDFLTTSSTPLDMNNHDKEMKIPPPTPQVRELVIHTVNLFEPLPASVHVPEHLLPLVPQHPIYNKKKTIYYVPGSSNWFHYLQTKTGKAKRAAKEQQQTHKLCEESEKRAK